MKSQRDVEFGAATSSTSAVRLELDDQSTAIDREFYDFNRTARWNSLDTSTEPTLSANPVCESLQYPPADEHGQPVHVLEHEAAPDRRPRPH